MSVQGRWGQGGGFSPHRARTRMLWLSILFLYSACLQWLDQHPLWWTGTHVIPVVTFHLPSSLEESTHPFSIWYLHSTPVTENYWNTGVLKPAQTSSRNSSRPHNQWYNIGCSESGMVRVFIPQKSAHTTNQSLSALFSENQLISFITCLRRMRDVGLICLVIHTLLHSWYSQKHSLLYNLPLTLWHFQE